MRPAGAAKVAQWWVKRWLLQRIEKEAVLARAAGHHFVHPIRHGARVRVPSEDQE